VLLNRQWQALAAGVDGFAVIFGQSAPNPVGLANLEGMGRALVDHGTSGADGLGGGLAGRAGRSALALGVEENSRILAAAGA
jgi:hypothetical protein